ncbi:hypothetical protein LTR53_009469 [Teratosphaeriaceae sp. CCFEE 6253]|nr:hypothetical protein LTR53_009469 [Teratosphaeriaceae sp. CCFEE 6253]
MSSMFAVALAELIRRVSLAPFVCLFRACDQPVALDLPFSVVHIATKTIPASFETDVAGPTVTIVARESVNLGSAVLPFVLCLLLLGVALGFLAVWYRRTLADLHEARLERDASEKQIGRNLVDAAFAAGRLNLLTILYAQVCSALATARSEDAESKKRLVDASHAADRHRPLVVKFAQVQAALATARSANEDGKQELNALKKEHAAAVSDAQQKHSTALHEADLEFATKERELTAARQQHSTEIELLNKDLTTANSQIDSNDLEINQLKTSRDKLAARLSRKHTQHVTALNEANSKVAGKESELTAAKEQHIVDAGRIKRDLTTAKSSIATKKSELDAMRASLVDAQNEAIAKKKQLDDMQQKLDSAVEQLAKAQIETTTRSEQLDDVQKELVNAREQLAEAQTERKRLVTDTKKHAKVLADYGARRLEVRPENDRIKKELVDMQKQRLVDAEDAANLSGRLSAAESKVATLENQQATHQRTLAEKAKAQEALEQTGEDTKRAARARSGITARDKIDRRVRAGIEAGLTHANVFSKQAYDRAVDAAVVRRQSLSQGPQGNNEHASTDLAQSFKVWVYYWSLDRGHQLS